MDQGKLRCLVNFVNATGVSHCIESLQELKDGQHFIRILQVICSSTEVPDCDNSIQRYRFILKYLEGFYQSSLKFHVDFSQIVNSASITELAKVTTLLLCAAIQSEKVKIFVDAITNLDLVTQNELKEIIQFIVAQESSHKLRPDFADILHRRGTQPSASMSISECTLTTTAPTRAESMSDSSSQTTLPAEPASPFVQSGTPTFTNSPLSPVHNLINSPSMINKLNNRRLHDRLRCLEKKLAAESALRQDLEMEVQMQNKEIGVKDGQLRELNQQVKELKKLKDEVDELQAVKDELRRSEREVAQLKKLLDKKAELKMDKDHLEKQNEELLSERHQLKYMMKDHESIKSKFEESRVRLRRSELNLGELHRENCRLQDELESALKGREEMAHMTETSQQMLKEKIALLEEQLMQASAPSEGESLGVITEQRVSELEQELQRLRTTWAPPEAHQKLKELYEESCRVNEASEVKLQQSQEEIASCLAREQKIQQDLQQVCSTWAAPDVHQQMRDMYEETSRQKQELMAELKESEAKISEGQVWQQRAKEVEQELQKLQTSWASPEVHQQMKDMYEEASLQKRELEVHLKECEEVISRGKVWEQRSKEMEAELQKLRTTWASPEVRHHMKDMYEEACRQKQEMETELKRCEEVISKGRVQEQHGKEIEVELQKLQTTWASPEVHQQMRDMYEEVCRQKQELEMDVKKFGEEISKGKLREQRSKEVELDLQKLRTTWASPEVHQQMKDMYEQACRQKQELEGNLTQLQQRISERETELHKLHMTWVSPETHQRLKDLLEETCQETQTNEKTLIESQQCVRKLEQELEGLRMTWVSPDTHSQKMRDKIEEMAQARDTSEASIKKQRDIAEVEAEKLKRERDEAKQSLARMEDQLQRARSSIRDLEEEKSVFHQTLSADKEEVKKTLCERETQLKSARASIEDLREEVLQQETKIQALNREKEEAEKTFCKQEVQLKQARTSFEDLQTKMLEQETMIQALTAGKEEAQKTSSHLEAELRQLKISFKDLQNLKLQQEMTIQTMKTDREDAGKALCEQEAQLKQAKTSIEHLQQERLQQETKVQGLYADKEEATKTLCEREAQLKQAKSTIRDLQNETLEQEAKIQALKTDKEEVRRTLQEWKAQLKQAETSIQDLQEEKLRLQQRLEESREAKMEGLDEEQRHIGRLEAEIKKLDADRDEVRRTLNEREGQLHQAAARLEDLTREREEILRIKQDSQTNLQGVQQAFEDLQRENAGLKQGLANKSELLAIRDENKKLYEEKISMLQDKLAQGDSNDLARQNRVSALEVEVLELRNKYQEVCQTKEKQEMAFKAELEQMKQLTLEKQFITPPRQTDEDGCMVTPLPLSQPDLNTTRDLAVADHSMDSLDGLGVCPDDNKDDSDLRMDDLETDGLQAPPPLRTESRASLASVASNKSTMSTRSRTRIEITLSAKRSVSRNSSRSGSQFDDISGILSQNSLGGSMNSLGADWPDNFARTLDDLGASGHSKFAASNRRDTLDTHRTTGPSGFFLVGRCEEEPDHVDWDDRLSELQRRNTLCRPHLQTSYPVETQTRPPQEVSETDLRIGTDTRRASMRLSGRVTPISETTSSRPSSRKRKSDEFKEEQPVTKQLRSSTSCQAMPPPPAPGGKGVMTRRAVSHSSISTDQAVATSASGGHGFTRTASIQSATGQRSNVLKPTTKCNSQTSLAGTRSSPRLSGRKSSASLASQSGSRTSLASHSSKASLAGSTSSLAKQTSRGGNGGGPPSRPGSRGETAEPGRTSLRSSKSSLVSRSPEGSSSSSSLHSKRSKVPEKQAKKKKEPVFPEIQEPASRRQSIAYSVGFSPKVLSRRRRSMRMSLAKKSSAKGSPGLTQVKTKVEKTPSKMKSMARFFGK